VMELIVDAELLTTRATLSQIRELGRKKHPNL